MYALISKTLRGNIAKGKLLDIYRFINLPDSITVNPVRIRPHLVGIWNIRQFITDWDSYAN